MDTQFNSSSYMKEATFPFWIDRYFHTHENVPPVHGHDFIELIYVVHGEAEHIFEGESYGIKAGDVFIINPGEVHTYRVKTDDQIEIINCLFMPELISEAWLRELGISQSMDYFYVHPFLDTTERFNHRLNLIGQDAAQVLILLEEMMNEFENKRSGYSHLIRLKMVELLILLSRYLGEREVNREEQTNRLHHRQLLVRRICGYLERHYDQKLSINSICQLFMISPRQLNRIVKQEAGLTVIEMVQRIRIEKAKHLLVETDDKVITIAGRVGYDDPAFFSRLFHRQVGCSPGKYREQFLSLEDD